MYLDIYGETEKRMQKSINSYQEELKSIRAGRANPALLDQINVQCYGAVTPLKQVASVSAPEARLLVIQPWDANLIPEIEKEILRSDLGLNPSNDGKLIRLPIPSLTEERRRELVRLVGKNAENAKVAIRNIRRDSNNAIKQMERDKELSEDERKLAEDEIQEITNRYIEKVDQATAQKEEELLEI
ncbi:MAG: ribosome recycling factor [Tissierellia bacterium]|nr:ribosome recycling factor [Tissierellia bacterium]